jgi:hypothetical protein
VKSRTPVLVAGLVIVVLGLVFSLGWFFVPIDVWLEDPSLVPMPEALVGWWIVAIGLALTAWSLRGRFRR